MAKEGDDDERTSLVHSSKTAGRPSQHGGCVAPRITVEPVLFLYYICTSTTALIIPQYLRHTVQAQYDDANNVLKTVTNVSYDGYFGYDANISELVDSKTSHFSTSCQKSSGTENSLGIDELVQADSAQIYATLYLVRSIPAIFATLFHGGCSDRLGRVIPITSALIGGVISTMVIIAVTFFNLPLYGLTVAYFLDGAFGETSVLAMACFAYISDVTSHTGRLLKLSIIECVLTIASATGSVASGYLVSGLGYTIPFLIILILNLTCVVYVLAMLKETVNTRQSVTCRYMCTSATQMTWSAVKLYYSDYRVRQKHLLILAISAILFLKISTTAETTLRPLYLMDTPFCMESVQLGVYQAVVDGVKSVGIVVLVPLLSARMSEVAFITFGYISDIASRAIMGIATSVWVLWLAAIVRVASVIPMAMMRTIMSQLAKPDEQGALFASISVCESVASLAGNAIIAPIYAATIGFMRGFAYLVIAAFMTVAMLLTICLGMLRKREGTKGYQETTTESKIGTK